MRRRQAGLAGAALGVLALAAAGSGTGPGAGPGPGIAARPGWAAAPALSISPGARVSAAADSPAGVGLTPAQIRTAYDLDPLLARGISGRGQTIVIVDSFGSPTIGRDLTGFDQAFGLPPPPAFTVIQPAGVVPPYRATSNREGWATETTLDVEWAHVMAPAARILLAETPTSENEGTTGFPQIVAAEEYVLRNHLGQVISQSFAATEQTFPSRASLLSLRAAYRLASARHVTVLAATGDTGATGETYNMRDLYTSRAVQWPATDPLVTAVGGTQLDLTSSGVRRRPDIAWSDGGGGRSIVFARPAYQDGVAGVTGSRRGVPDIAMDASCASGVAIYASFGGTGPEHWDGVCGTSLATPLLAGVVALADQVAGHPLGLINPALYRMLAHHERGLTDILTGSNSMTFDQGGTEHTVAGFSARRGYDLVSGTGTIDARYFVPELARAAGRAPAAPAPALPRAGAPAGLPTGLPGLARGAGAVAGRLSVAPLS
jgi:subtilase family serine protease